VRPKRLALLLAMVTLAALPAAAASAQQPEGSRGTSPTASLTIDRITGTLTPGADFGLRVRVRNDSSEPLQNPAVLVTRYREFIGRWDYQQAVDHGRIAGNLLRGFATDLDAIPARGSAVAELRQTAAQMGFGRPAGLYGVYPLRVQLLAGGEVLDEVVTSLVLSPAEVTAPLRIALLAPLDAEPARLPDGVYRGDRLGASVAPGGRLHDLVAGLTAHPGFPVTIATSGLFLEQAADLADGFLVAEPGGVREADPDTGLARQAESFLATLADTLARPEVEHVALPYGPADLVALTRGGLGSEAVRAVVEGGDTSEALTGARPSHGVLWPPGGLDSATLSQVQAAPVRMVVLSESQLALPVERGPTSLSPSPVRPLRSPAGSRVTALVADPWLETVMEPSGQSLAHGRAVAAQRIIAETAAVFFEQPGVADRGLLLAPPQGWFPAPGLLGSLLEGLDAAPWLRPVTLTDLAAAVAPEDGAVQLEYPASARNRELGPDYVTQLGLARQLLGSFAQAVPTDPSPERFDRLLLQAASVHYRDPDREADGQALLSEVLDTIGSVYDGVAVPEMPPVTLTSVEGQIPVTLRNDSDVALQVRVVLGTRALEFADGGTREMELEPQSVNTLLFQARTLVPGGTAPVTVSIQDPGGSMVLASGLVVVRTTAYSVAALVVTGGAALFLLAWLGRDLARRRRRRGAKATARADRPTTVA
jgi:hypothetical protein